MVGREHAGLSQSRHSDGSGNCRRNFSFVGLSTVKLASELALVGNPRLLGQLVWR